MITTLLTDLSHTEIDILRGLVFALIDQEVISQSPIDAIILSNLSVKLDLAHDQIVKA